MKKSSPENASPSRSDTKVGARLARLDDESQKLLWDIFARAGSSSALKSISGLVRASRRSDVDPEVLFKEFRALYGSEKTIGEQLVYLSRQSEDPSFRTAVKALVGLEDPLIFSALAELFRTLPGDQPELAEASYALVSRRLMAIARLFRDHMDAQKTLGALARLLELPDAAQRVQALAACARLLQRPEIDFDLLLRDVQKLHGESKSWQEHLRYLAARQKDHHLRSAFNFLAELDRPSDIETFALIVRDFSRTTQSHSAPVEASGRRERLRILSRLFRDDNDMQKTLSALGDVSDHEKLAATRSVVSTFASPRVSAKQASFHALLTRSASTAEDLMATRAEALWLEDPDFQAAYSAGASVAGWKGSIRWRVYTLLMAAKKAARLEGDFVECGVASGGTAMNVIEGLGAKALQDRRFFLFDTFEGLDTLQVGNAERGKVEKPEGYYPPVLDQVRRSFSSFPFVRIVPGSVPKTLSAYDGDKVAYLHIDMNVSVPEIEALRFFWPKLVPGGVVVFDDYAFPAHLEQQRQLNTVAAEFGVEIMMLPTGQGLLWK